MRIDQIIAADEFVAPAARTRHVAEARRAMETSGSATFEGFVRPAALASMLSEARAVQRGSYRRDAQYTAYMPDEAVGDAQHPTRRTFRYALDAVANDHLDPHGALSTLYRDERFIRFVADVLHEPQLHPLGDPMLGLTLTFLQPGDEHGWHFDRNDFVVSLLLQASESGGVFEYAPFIRSEIDPNYAAVDAIMKGGDDGLERIAAKPGTLAIFAGKRSLHHVSRVTGTTTRIIALLSYDRTPGLVHDDAVHLRTFGRVPLTR